MFREFIRWALGPIGREALLLYTEYNLPINLIVLLYGVILFIPHFSLIKTINRIEQMILAMSSSAGSSPKDIEALYNELIDKWSSMVHGKTLVLPTKNDLWFELHEAPDVLKLLQIDEDYVRMALHKHTGDPPLRLFTPIKFYVWEKYRRRLKKGVRGLTPDEVLERRQNADV